MSWHPRVVVYRRDDRDGRCHPRGGIGPRAEVGSRLGRRAPGRRGRRGIGSWLAAKRLLRDATACLAALGDDGDGPERWRTRGRTGTGRYRSWDRKAFDAWIAHLHEVLDHFEAGPGRARRRDAAGAATASRDERAGRSRRILGEVGAGSGRDGPVAAVPPGPVPTGRGAHQPGPLGTGGGQRASGLGGPGPVGGRLADRDERGGAVRPDRPHRPPCRRGGRRLRTCSSRGPPGARPGAQRHRGRWTGS